MRLSLINWKLLRKHFLFLGTLVMPPAEFKILCNFSKHSLNSVLKSPWAVQICNITKFFPKHYLSAMSTYIHILPSQTERTNYTPQNRNWKTFEYGSNTTEKMLLHFKNMYLKRNAEFALQISPLKSLCIHNYKVKNKKGKCDDLPKSCYLCVSSTLKAIWFSPK